MLVQHIVDFSLVEQEQRGRRRKHPGGHSLIKVTRVPTLRFLPRAAQQLKILPRADTKSHFWHPRADAMPHFDSLRADK